MTLLEWAFLGTLTAAAVGILGLLKMRYDELRREVERDAGWHRMWHERIWEDETMDDGMFEYRKRAAEAGRRAREIVDSVAADLDEQLGRAFAAAMEKETEGAVNPTIVRNDCAFCHRERTPKDDNHADTCPYWTFFGEGH